MSDKSFGDFVNRNTVKNPLLSTSVTGLSFEDLTHNAVLLPVPQAQPVNAPQDKQQGGAKNSTLAHPHFVDNYQSGDAKFNPIVNQLNKNTVESSLINVNTGNNNADTSLFYSSAKSTQSKAVAKTEDDFDVNEYIARLQSSVYVSAPINSHISQEDKNATLDAAEENLEEVNLNDPDKPNEDVYQQSITADIAQNFSQLPTVLPQMASAVFSSFSNMLSYKSKESSPADDQGAASFGYHEVQYQTQGVRPPETVSLIGVNEPVKDAAVAPPKQPPVGGISNYRITTKKKIYAQIPGLSTGDVASIPVNHPPAQRPELNVPYFAPTNPTSNINISIGNQTHAVSAPNENVPENNPLNVNTVNVNEGNEVDLSSIIAPMDDRVIGGHTNEQSNYALQTEDRSATVTLSEVQPTANAPPVKGSIIPPPPMFSNLPKKDSQTSVEKAVLPPSVARRLAGNTPKNTIQRPLPLMNNIFIPSLPETEQYAASSDPTQPSLMFSSSLTASTGAGPLYPSVLQTTPMLTTTNLPVSNNASQVISFDHQPTGNFQTTMNNPTLTQTSIATNDTPVPNRQNLPPNISSKIEETNVPTSAIQFTDTQMESKSQSSGIVQQSLTKQPSHQMPLQDFSSFAQYTPPSAPAFGPTNAPSAIFNPIQPQKQYQGDQILSYFNSNPKSMTPPEMPKQLPEPPKISSGNVNFRMTKKRPQYYAGPIEGIGAISNNVKPNIVPVPTMSYQGALFTPDVTANIKPESVFESPALDQSTVPFNTQTQVNTAHEPFDLNRQQAMETPHANTVFDLSRETTDNYDAPKEQSKGFGIIGSLKSKLSSLDINKIQSKVTTFFDPDYSTPQETNNPSTYPYNSGHAYDTQSHSTNFDIYVPSADQQAQLNHYSNYENKNQLFDYNQQSIQYDDQSNYYQTPAQQETYDNNAKLIMAYNYSPNYSETVAVQEVASNSSDSNNENRMSQDQDHNSHISPLFVNESKAYHTIESAKSKEELYSASNQINDESAHRFFDHPETNLTNPTHIDELNKNGAQGDARTAPNNFSSFFSSGEENLNENLFSKLSLNDNNEENRNVNNKITDKAVTYSPNENTEGTLLFAPSSTYNEDIKMLENNSIDFATDALTVQPIDDPEVFFDKLDFSAKTNESGSINTIVESDLTISETCKEVDKNDEIVSESVTALMIENIIAPIQLSNPVEVPLTDSYISEGIDYESGHCEEISLITDETIEPIHVKSATYSLAQDDKAPNTIYGWNLKSNANYALDHTYGFENDANAIASNENNLSFFENLPRNACDEQKAEIKSNFDESSPSLTRQMSIPTAPLEDDLDDAKSDETGGLDVNLIEQDAKQDFPIYEEFLIEPSETDDDKIEYKEREKSSDDSVPYSDTFTNRIERFKMMEETGTESSEENIKDIHEYLQSAENPSSTSPALTFASYFDTGNYAVDTHYRNSMSSPPAFKSTSPYLPSKIPPGFEDEYRRRLSLMYNNDPTPDVPVIPDTTTQTKTTQSYSYVQNSKVDDCITQSNMSVLDAIPKSQLQCTTSSYITSSKVQEGQKCLTEIIESREKSKINEENLPDFRNAFGSVIDKSAIISKNPYGDSIEITGCGNAVEKKVAKNVSQEGILRAIKEITVKAQTGISLEKDTIDDPILFPIPVTKTRDEVTKDDCKNQLQQILPDPINFFSTEPSSKSSEDVGFNRLASYFSLPPKEDNSKSFFELSQSQKHYKQETDNHRDIESKRAITKDKCVANLNLIKDLTSAQNLEFSQNDTIVRTVNFFTVVYDNEDLNIKINNNKLTDVNSTIELNDNSETSTESEPEASNNFKDVGIVISSCSKCNIDSELDSEKQLAKSYNFHMLVKNTMNADDSKSKSEGPTNMEEKTSSNNGSVNIDVVSYDIDNREDGGIALMSENRATSSEYSPVKHHWFYKVDCEDKCVWRGFSIIDSQALEEAFNSPDLNENTYVATDGGRYDVNIVGRLRVSVYWSDKPSNVLRCSWFYKGTTDARYVPYTEDVAEKLEEEYRHGMRTGEWHRRLMLPNNEMVVMHGPAVMVHFLQGPTADAYTPASVYILEGAPADAFNLASQSAMRPLVVRRGHDESEIEDCEPSNIDHLLLLCHGVGSACDMRFRVVEEVVNDFRATSSQLIQSHYRTAFDQGVVGRVEVLPISWHSSLHAGEAGVDRRLARLTLDSIPKLRNFTNDTVLDVLFYTSPVYCQTILDTVCKELNKTYNLFKSRNPNFTGSVSLGGHSLGSVILYDLLCHQSNKPSEEGRIPTKHFVNGSPGTQPHIKYPQLHFAPEAMYALGSPIAMFECIRGVDSLGMEFALPTCNNFFNIFHPYDPIAYRIEPLINPQLKDLKPYLIPHHKGRKRMHLELRDTMARVGADLKQKLVESIKTTWSSMWRSQPPTEQQLEKVVEEEIEKEKEQLAEATDDAAQNINITATPEMLGRLNDGRRVDYVLQEAPFEMINEYLFAMRSHVGYWESEDTMLLILREIYESLGVQPDSSLPQQTLTVHRTKILNHDAETQFAAGGASTSNNP